MLTLAALFVPEWRPSGVGPSLVQQTLETLSAPRTPNCVDSCGGGHLPGYAFFVGAWIVVLLLTTAFQVFLPVPDAPAGGAAGFVLFLGLIVFVPLLLVVAGEVTHPGVTFTYDQFGNMISQSPSVPDWGALADSLVLTAGGGLLLIVIGSSMALIGAMLRSRS